jgi:hypothetical protein
LLVWRRWEAEARRALLLVILTKVRIHERGGREVPLAVFMDAGSSPA